MKRKQCDFGGSTTPAEHKDSWATPEWLYQAIATKYQFVLDAAASASNRKCAAFISEEQNALEQDWKALVDAQGGGDVWVNPPYSRGMIEAFINQAIAETQKGLRVVMLVPATPDAGWWPSVHGRCASQITFITQGRINFISAVSGEIVAGNPKGSAILEFDPTSCHRAAPEYNSISRAELLEIGKPLAELKARAEAERPAQDFWREGFEQHPIAAEVPLEDCERLMERLHTAYERWSERTQHPFPTPQQVRHLIRTSPVDIAFHGRRLVIALESLARTSALAHNAQ